MTNETLLAEAILGRDAAEFCSSDLGRYLLGRAQQEHAEALEKLSDVDASDEKSIRALQAQAWRAKSFKGWLVELIAAGNSAESALEESGATGDEP